MIGSALVKSLQGNVPPFRARFAGADPAQEQQQYEEPEFHLSFHYLSPRYKTTPTIEKGHLYRQPFNRFIFSC